MLLIVIRVLLLDGNNHLTGMCTSTTQKGFLSFSSGSVQVIKQLLLSLNLRFFFQLYTYEHLCCHLFTKCEWRGDSEGFQLSLVERGRTINWGLICSWGPAGWCR